MQILWITLLTSLFSMVLPLPLTAAETMGIVVQEAWIRTAPSSSKILAGYLSIENTQDQTQTLVGADSSNFERVEIHQTEMHNGMASMKKLASIDIPAKSKLAFSPGGVHLMLIGAKKTFKEGDMVMLNLNFKNGTGQMVHALVRRSDKEMEPAQMDHSHMMH
ncbi:MAG: copper chaperone PCu(A)C [Magnetococcus sp. DMHC-6]